MSGLLAITWVLGVESTWVSVFRPSHLFARPDQKIAHNWAETEFWYFCVFVNLLVWICVLLCAYLFMNSSHLALWSPKPQDWSPEHNTGVLWMFWTMHVIQLKNCLGFIFLMTELWTSNQTYWECKCKLFSKKEECFPGCPTCSMGRTYHFLVEVKNSTTKPEGLNRADCSVWKVDPTILRIWQDIQSLSFFNNF